MRIPTIRALIDRRVLVNFRVDPEVLAGICPAPFRPQVVDGFGIAGICLIRLTQIRRPFLPAFVGMFSENAAHRIAVPWDTDVDTRTGVFVTRRDTSSALNALAGGRLFPGVQNHASFDICEQDDNYRIAMNSLDDSVHVTVDGQTTDELPPDSIFTTLAACSQLFESGSLGYSPSNTAHQYDGIELQSIDWQVEPLSISEVRASFFDDEKTFPAGSISFDNALLMRGMDHQWHSRGSTCCHGD